MQSSIANRDWSWINYYIFTNTRDVDLSPWIWTYCMNCTSDRPFQSPRNVMLVCIPWSYDYKQTQSLLSHPDQMSEAKKFRASGGSFKLHLVMGFAIMRSLWNLTRIKPLQDALITREASKQLKLLLNMLAVSNDPWSIIFLGMGITGDPRLIFNNIIVRGHFFCDPVGQRLERSNWI